MKTTKLLKVAYIGIVLNLALFMNGAYAQWTYEQKFNTLTDGNLNGQDSWSGGAGEIVVQTTTKYEGAKGISLAASGSTYAVRDITEVQTGIVYVAMRAVNNTTGGIYFYLYHATTSNNWVAMVGFHGNGYIISYDQSLGAYVNIAPYVAGQWYIMAIEIDCPNRNHRIKVHNGTAWSAWTAWFQNTVEANLGVNRIGMISQGPSAGYIDFITPTDPIIVSPTTQTSNVTFQNIQSCGMTLGWTRPGSGGGSNCAVFMYAGSTGTSAPADGTTYTANTVFGSSGSQIGSTGWYCVYNGTGTSVAVNGLTAGTTYRVHVCEYNGSGGSEKYLTSAATDNPKNQATTTISYGAVGSGNQTVSSGATPSSMGVTGATGSGSFSYQWYSQNGIVSCPSGSTIGAWTTLGSSNGANTATYSPASGITASTSYACFVTPGGSPTCGTATWASSCRLVTVTTPANVDWNKSNVQEITLSANRSFTFTNGKSGGFYTLIIKQDGTGGRTVIWPEDVKWAGGTEPAFTTSAGAIDLVKFVYDGTNYLISSLMLDIK
ncbi:MAG: hypothetical protein HGB12_01200 [Bacteroidetes bacterium]|nr:hypothetical protein [Bacteroidota bacterium]